MRKRYTQEQERRKWEGRRKGRKGGERRHLFESIEGVLLNGVQLGRRRKERERRERAKEQVQGGERKREKGKEEKERERRREKRRGVFSAKSIER